MWRCYGPHPDDRIEFSYKDIHHLVEHAQVLAGFLAGKQGDWLRERSVTIADIEALYEELNKVKDHVDARIFEMMTGDTIPHLHLDPNDIVGEGGIPG